MRFKGVFEEGRRHRRCDARRPSCAYSNYPETANNFDRRNVEGIEGNLAYYSLVLHFGVGGKDSSMT
jgi:hypothetical protein